MQETSSALWSAIAMLIGLSVFVALMIWVARNHSAMWRRLSAIYEGSKRGGALATKLDVFVIAERGSGGAFAHRQYAGLRMALHRDGISAWLIPIPPLNIGCPPLFLPFAEMTVAETDWMLWPDPIALRMGRAPDLDIIIGRDTLRWIREHVTAAPFGLDR